MFSRLARRYDILNTIITLGRHRCWKRATAIAAGAAQGQGPGLDVATGTGDLAFTLGEQANVTSVVAVDLSRAMLKVASRKSSERSAACPVSFLEGRRPCPTIRRRFFPLRRLQLRPTQRGRP